MPSCTHLRIIFSIQRTRHAPKEIQRGSVVDSPSVAGPHPYSFEFISRVEGVGVDMEEIRKQLDSLMGQHRDVPLAQREMLKKTVVFSNHEVCKYHLCGFCPHSEFTKTKQDLGPCPKLHDEECKRAWEALSDREKERYGYEEQLLRRLDRFKSDLARRIAINTGIIEKTAAKSSIENMYTADELRRLDGMAQDIEGMLLQAQYVLSAPRIRPARAHSRYCRSERSHMVLQCHCYRASRAPVHFRPLHLLAGSLVCQGIGGEWRCR